MSTALKRLTERFEEILPEITDKDFSEAYGYQFYEQFTSDIEEEGFPDGTEYENINAEIEVTPNRTAEDMAEEFMSDNEIRTVEEADELDDSTLIDFAVSNTNNFTFELTINEDLKEHLDMFPTIEYASELAEKEQGDIAMREYLENSLGADVQDRLVEAIRDMNFPDGVSTNEIDWSTGNFRPSRGWNALGDLIVDNSFGESALAYVNGSSYITTSLDDGLWDYDIEIHSDPEDFKGEDEDEDEY